MPLNAKSSIYLHVFQNLSLISLSLLFCPLVTLITLLSSLVSRISLPKHAETTRREDRRKILITGVSMSKGLFLARSFYLSGHTVIGADFIPYTGLPFLRPFGSVSRSVSRFYVLRRSCASAYTADLLDVIEKERIDLWVSCSGVASAVEDGQAAEAISKRTAGKCRVVQFGVELMETLHDKDRFIANTEKLGLNVPTTIGIRSIEEGMNIVYSKGDRERDRMEWIMKSVGMDDSIRADLTLLPRKTRDGTELFFKRLNPNHERPFVLQQFVRGKEYCTHSLVHRGKVKAFTSCESAELLMHYRILHPEEEAAKAMLRYTQIYAEKMGEEMTGHFSIDFILREDETHQGEDILKRLCPIECNPRAHTAVVLFSEQMSEMVDAYLEVLNHTTGSKEKREIVIPTSTIGYYWIGHDIIANLILPLCSFVALRTDTTATVSSLRTFIEHVTMWKDGTFEVWDPWPFWWLYCIYMPAMFLMSILTRDWWSRCNVSTGKFFRC